MDKSICDIKREILKCKTMRYINMDMLDFADDANAITDNSGYSYADESEADIEKSNWLRKVGRINIRRRA